MGFDIACVSRFRHVSCETEDGHPESFSGDFVVVLELQKGLLDWSTVVLMRDVSLEVSLSEFPEVELGEVDLFFFFVAWDGNVIVVL